MIRLLAALLLAAATAGARADPPVSALAMHGEPALSVGFEALPYVNPDAPKGGTLRLAYLGSFDSLNPYNVPYNVRSLSAAEGLVGHVFESLMARSRDEPFTLYGLIARSVETDEARDYVTFRLDPAARFSDGTPVSSADVRFTFELLRQKGPPPQRAAFALVKSVETPDLGTIRFDLAGASDRELPLILALMPVLPSRLVDADRFDEPSLNIPVGAGPYLVDRVEPGRRMSTAVIPAIGAAIFQSIAAGTTSTQSKSSIFTTPRRYSPPSPLGFTMSASRTTLRAGETRTTFPRSGGATCGLRLSRSGFPQACGVSYSTHDVRYFRTCVYEKRSPPCSILHG